MHSPKHTSLDKNNVVEIVWLAIKSCNVLDTGTGGVFKSPNIGGGVKILKSQWILTLTPFHRDSIANPQFGGKVHGFEGQLSGRVPSPSSVRYVLTPYPNLQISSAQWPPQRCNVNFLVRFLCWTLEGEYWEVNFLRGEFFWGLIIWWKKQDQKTLHKNSGPNFGRPKFVSQHLAPNSVQNPLCRNWSLKFSCSLLACYYARFQCPHLSWQYCQLTQRLPRRLSYTTTWVDVTIICP